MSDASIGEINPLRKTAHHIYLVIVFYEIKQHGIIKHN